ncbi:MAG TPA: serine O-acetyltransferase [Kiritimatiellia bacterium]|nr:serine O-acetyltransferase [Kiritimatiellia bacterium]HRZ13215.1 serine O-acetyltransferase [Kiritimatiellia bacterium]HSA18664.1 serine O-acetyltransferase [Kiritimatiellia bacterium]
MKHPATHECTGTGAEYCLCRAATGLLSLYSGGPEDRADSLLGSYPNTTNIEAGLRILIDVMLPGRMSQAEIQAEELGLFLVRRLGEAWRLLRPEVERAVPFRWIGQAARMEGAPKPVDPRGESVRIMQAFVGRLGDIRKLLVEDIRAAYEGDPAALTYAEVQLAYPGLLAIASHRLAHEFYKLKVPIVPRVMSEWTHSQTGVDIHPGAEIGHGFFIDHATGVVIGETTHIGHRVKLYQGVTLGARSFSLDAQGQPVKHVKRHPTVEDDVVIYAHATILGGDTVIGRGSTIGANVFLMESVPPKSFVTSKHAELHIKRGNEET